MKHPMRSSKYFKEIERKVQYINDSALNMESVVEAKSNEDSIFNFDSQSFAFAPFGGAFATFPNLSDRSQRSFDVSIYSADLKLIKNIRPSSEKRLTLPFLTPEELLVLVYEESLYEIFNLNGDKIFSDQLIREGTVFMNYVAPFDGGFFAVTFDNQCFCVENYSKIFFKTRLPLDTQRGYAVPPLKDDDLYGPILYATSFQGNQFKMVVAQKGLVKVFPFLYEVTDLAFSADYNLVALLTKKAIYVYPPNFDEPFGEISLPPEPVLKIYWVGSSFILIQVKGAAYVVGLSDNCAKYEFPNGYAVSTEVDGARIISNEGVYFCSQIPPELLPFIKGGDSPGKKLFNHFQDPEAQVTINISSIITSMDEAVNQCVQAANYFRQKEIRKDFVKAVSKSGKNISGTISTIRIVLSLEEYSMPLTFNQYLALGQERLLARLCNRRLHFLAFRISDYLNISSDSIYSHFAECLIRSDLEKNVILNRFTQLKANFDLVELALLAFSLNKDELGSYLLANNPIQSRCVPLFIQRNQWNEALESAIKSNDTTLLVWVIKQILELSQTTDESKLGEKKKAEDIIQRISQHPEALYAYLFMVPDPNKKVELLSPVNLKAAQVIQFENARKNNGAGAENLRKDNWVVDLYYKILSFVKEISKPDWKDLSPSDIYQRLVEDGDEKNAEKAEKAFKLSKDETLWIRVHSFAQKGNLNVLKALLSKAKPETLGDIVEYLCDEKKNDLAKNFVNAIQDTQVAQALMKTIPGQ